MRRQFAKDLYELMKKDKNIIKLKLDYNSEKSKIILTKSKQNRKIIYILELFSLSNSRASSGAAPWIILIYGASGASDCAGLKARKKTVTVGDQP